MTTLVRTALILLFAVTAAHADEPKPAPDMPKDTLVVTADFPTGSGVVQELEQSARRIKLVPTKHKGRGWDAWWHVKVSGITAGETVTLDVGDQSWATPDHSFYSVDDGKTWQQTAAGKRAGKRIVYSIKVDATKAAFAWGPPYGADRTARLLEGVEREPASVKPGEPVFGTFLLCRSRENREVLALEFLPPKKSDGTYKAKPFGVVVVARQHAWEAGSSWVCEGLVKFLVSDDKAAKALRENAIIYVVPIMDVDNVEIGAGGKNQEPHDHNRDWADQPIYPAVAACQELIKGLDKDGMFDLYIDLHNPAANDKAPFYFTGAEELHKEPGISNRKLLVELSKRHITGPLPFKGDTRPSGRGYDKSWQNISGNWVSKHTSPHVVAICLETAWNTPHSTAENYQTVGRQLGETVAAYLKERKKD